MLLDSIHSQTAATVRRAWPFDALLRTGLPQMRNTTATGGKSGDRHRISEVQEIRCLSPDLLVQANAETAAALRKQLQIAGWRLSRSTAKGDELRRVPGAIDNL